MIASESTTIEEFLAEEDALARQKLRFFPSSAVVWDYVLLRGVEYDANAPMPIYP